MNSACFIFDLLSTTLRNKIEAIHNTALRIIFKKDRLFGTERLLKLANEKKMEVRLRELKNRYLDTALANNNPLIAPLHDEYTNFAGGRVIETKTIMCGYTRRQVPRLTSYSESDSDAPSP